MVKAREERKGANFENISPSSSPSLRVEEKKRESDLTRPQLFFPSSLPLPRWVVWLRPCNWDSKSLKKRVWVPPILTFFPNFFFCVSFSSSSLLKLRRQNSLLFFATGDFKIVDPLPPLLPSKNAPPHKKNRALNSASLFANMTCVHLYFFFFLEVLTPAQKRRNKEKKGFWMEHKKNGATWYKNRGEWVLNHSFFLILSRRRPMANLFLKIQGEAKKSGKCHHVCLTQQVKLLAFNMTCSANS